MLPCKSPQANLENCSKLFICFGLALALFIVKMLIDYQSKSGLDAYYYENQTISQIKEETIPETTELEKPQEIHSIPTTPILTAIKIVSDDKKIEEIIIKSTETNESERIIIQKIEIKDVKEEKVVEEVVENIPFFIIEEVPKFPGCIGNNEELKKCTEEKIRSYVYEKFNTEISQELGLESGIQKIYVQFIIDKNGNISHIECRAPHKTLQLEAERVVKSLPKMEPGKQRGKPVGVKYTLPIVFKVM